MTVTDADQQIQIYAGSFVAGFFDLLGQQDRLRDIREIPRDSDPEGIARLREQIQQSYGIVLGFRDTFTKFFDGFSESDLDISSLNAAQQEDFRAFSAHDIRLQPMSDSVVAYTSAFGPGSRISLKGIFGLLAAATGSMLTCLAAGFPLRGGIDLGISLVIDDKEFYGPVLARAYTLESKVAQYPRVVVGDELVNFLDTFAADQGQSLERKMAQGIAKACLELCAEDADGRTFLDFLGPGSKKHLGKDIPANVIARAVQNVFQFQESAKADRNQILAFRYALLADYCIAMSKHWGVEIE